MPTTRKLKPAYIKTFNGLFKGQHNIEPWLQEYITDGNGVDSPSEKRTIAGKMYELYNICQPRNCPGNVIYVLFEPGGAQAWALFVKNDGTSRFFGNPDTQIREALKAEAN